MVQHHLMAHSTGVQYQYTILVHSTSTQYWHTILAHNTGTQYWHTSAVTFDKRFGVGTKEWGDFKSINDLLLRLQRKNMA